MDAQQQADRDQAAADAQAAAAAAVAAAAQNPGGAPANAAATASLLSVLQTLINQLNTGGAGGTGGTGSTGGGTAAVAFATTPGQVNISDVIDLLSKSGKSIFDTAVTSIPIKFDLKSGQTLIFVKQLAARARQFGWSAGPMNITKFDVRTADQIAAGAPKIEKDLLTEYGQIPEDILKARVELWITGTMKNTRATQNNEMMATCLTASLTEEASTRLLSSCALYTDDEGQISAPMFFKTIMRIATLDSKATTSMLRENLRDLPSYMIKCNSNIDDYHLFFTTNHTQLIGRGETLEDPMNLLFNGYFVATDANFQKWAHEKEDQWMEDSPLMANCDHLKLITMASNKYNVIKAKGNWGAKSAADLKIVALSAELAGLKGEFKLSKAMLEKATSDTKNKKPTGDKKFQKEIEVWKKKPPGPNEPSIKDVKGKTYHWCVHHMAWCIHTPEECNLGQKLIAEAALPPAPTAAAAAVPSSPPDASGVQASSAQWAFPPALQAAMARLAENSVYD